MESSFLSVSMLFLLSLVQVSERMGDWKVGVVRGKNSWISKARIHKIIPYLIHILMFEFKYI